MGRALKMDVGLRLSQSPPMNPEAGRLSTIKVLKEAESQNGTKRG
jgi:hypothetical protein